MAMMVVPSHSKHSKEVHRQTHATDDEKLSRVVHLGRLDDPLHGFKDDEDADEDQEDAVGEAAECLDSVVTVGIDIIATPCAHDTGKKTHANSSAVEEHVNSITDQSERIRPYSPHQLHSHEGQIEAKELENFARIVVSHDDLDGLARRQEEIFRGFR
jgi:hypothetical protein